MIAHFLNNAILLTLATLRVDERLGHLGTPASVAIFCASVLVAVAGAALLRRGETRGPIVG
jgi:hypothetical protein